MQQRAKVSGNPEDGGVRTAALIGRRALWGNNSTGGSWVDWALAREVGGHLASIRPMEVVVEGMGA